MKYQLDTVFLEAIISNIYLVFFVLMSVYKKVNLIKDFLKINFVEIGSGLSGLIVHLINLNKKIKNRLKIIIYDLPEVLSMSYVLTKSIFPEKKVYLNRFISNPFYNDFDVLFLPSDKFHLLDNNSADVIYNSCSLSEMDSKDSNQYINLI
jgi:putative sugar O-methyltransferase